MWDILKPKASLSTIDYLFGYSHIFHFKVKILTEFDALHYWETELWWNSAFGEEKAIYRLFNIGEHGSAS